MKRVWYCNVIDPLIKPGSPVYELSAWPPPDDQPLSHNAEGKILSCVGDDIYDLTPFARIGTRIRFDDDRLTPINRRRYKRVVCWWLWGTRGRITISSVHSYATIIKTLFLVASEHRVDVTKLSSVPNAAQVLARALSKSTFDTFLMLLDELLTQRSEVGFTLLDRAFLIALARLMPEHELQQTPYIPPRIWLHQVTRLKACIDDFLAHRDKLEATFKYCLRAYIENYGSIEAACSPDGARRLGPFNSDIANPHIYLGPFEDTARKFGINDLLKRWLRPEDGKDVDESLVGVQRLAAYFNMVQLASLAYILNFTAMRGLEAKDLRSSCFLTEEHDEYGDIFLIRGRTSKTVRESETDWITSPSVKDAVTAAATVASLRAAVAKQDPNVYLPVIDGDDPLLYTPGYEPWMFIGKVVRTEGPKARQRPQFKQILDRFPALLDTRELTITEEDLHIARQITPTLDPEIFKVGAVWPIAFHQLRRTAAVNMTASGIVDISSLQYQLKHGTRMQSLYYGRGSAKLRFNQRAVEEHVRTTYEMLALQANRLSENRYLSPLGPENKQRILSFVADFGEKGCVKALKKGLISLRPTLIGLCTKVGPCPFGGFDNVSQCGRCADALVDRTKLEKIKHMEKVTSARIAAASPQSPRRKGLLAQQTSLHTARTLIEASDG